MLAIIMTSEPTGPWLKMHRPLVLSIQQTGCIKSRAILGGLHHHCVRVKVFGTDNRHLNRRDIFKQNRAAALAEWRQLAA
jgi:hypothetical protein